MPETTDESKRNRRTAKRILAIGLPLVVIAGTGLGYAYWTGGGTGSGAATTVTPTDSLSFTDVNPPSDLSPDNTTPSAISVDVTNNGANSVHVTTVTVAFATSPVTGLHASTGPLCSTSDYTLTGTLTSGTAGGVDIPAGQKANFTGATIVFANDLAKNQDSCKGATVHFAYAAS